MSFTIKVTYVIDKWFTSEFQCVKGCINKNKVRNHKEAAAQWKKSSVISL